MDFAVTRIFSLRNGGVAKVVEMGNCFLWDFGKVVMCRFLEIVGGALGSGMGKFDELVWHGMMYMRLC